MIGGKTLSDVLKFAGSDLYTLNDCRPGPLTTAGTATAFPGTAFNRVWKITQAEIDYHIANYTSGGYVPAAIISEWPSPGNPLHPLDMGYFAPFYGVNGNVIYDPTMAGHSLAMTGITETNDLIQHVSQLG